MRAEQEDQPLHFGQVHRGEDAREDLQGWRKEGEEGHVMRCEPLHGSLQEGRAQEQGHVRAEQEDQPLQAGSVHRGEDVRQAQDVNTCCLKLWNVKSAAVVMDEEHPCVFK